MTDDPAVAASWNAYPAEVLTPDEVAALIDACSAKSRIGIRNRALLTLLSRSGLRLSEAIGDSGRPAQRYTGLDGRVKTQGARDAIAPLMVSDVDLATRTIRLLQTKSGKPQTRRLHPEAVDSIARWLDVRCQLGLDDRHPLFCTLRGKPLHDQYVRTLLGRLAEKAGIEKRVHPHAFRHTFAVELENAGVIPGLDLEKLGARLLTTCLIARQLGHGSVAVTVRDYLAPYAASRGEWDAETEFCYRLLLGDDPDELVTEDELTAWISSIERDGRITRRWKELTAQADHAQVERMLDHVEAQAAQLPPSHRLKPVEGVLVPDAIRFVHYFGTRFPTPEENAEMMRRLAEGLDGDEDAPDL